MHVDDTCRLAMVKVKYNLSSIHVSARRYFIRNRCLHSSRELVGLEGQKFLNIQCDQTSVQHHFPHFPGSLNLCLDEILLLIVISCWKFPNSPWRCSSFILFFFSSCFAHMSGVDHGRVLLSKESASMARSIGISCFPSYLCLRSNFDRCVVSILTDVLRSTSCPALGVIKVQSIQSILMQKFF